MAKQKKGVKKDDPHVVGTHIGCGGDVKWVRVSPQTGRARMAKVCQKCGEEGCDG